MLHWSSFNWIFHIESFEHIRIIVLNRNFFFHHHIFFIRRRHGLGIYCFFFFQFKFNIIILFRICFVCHCFVKQIDDFFTFRVNIIAINQNFILFYQSIIAFLFRFRQTFAKTNDFTLCTFDRELSFMCDVKNIFFDAMSLFHKNNQFNFLFFYVDEDWAIVVDCFLTIALHTFRQTSITFNELIIINN